jgi:lipopolysaccharide export system protein LptC
MDYSIGSIWYYSLRIIQAAIAVLFQNWMWLLLVSLTLVTTWLVRNFEKDLSSSSQMSDHIPDYVLYHFQSTQLNEQGYLKSRLIAEKMVHYLQAKTELTTPTMVFYQHQQPVWKIQAERGEISSDDNEIWLLGQTHWQRYTSNKTKELEIITRDVRLQRDTQYAETALATQIVSAYGDTYSVGMRVFLPQEKIELLSQVRGNYVLP